MRFIYYYTGTVNGEDALGHYIRCQLRGQRVLARLDAETRGCGATVRNCDQSRPPAAGRQVSVGRAAAPTRRDPARLAAALLNYLLAS